MKDHPIIFSRPMVLALLAGRKTQTRRLLYIEKKVRHGIPPMTGEFLIEHRPPTSTAFDTYFALSGWQRVKPGDRLWVRENWRADDFDKDDPDRTIYQADAPAGVLAETKGIIKWRPCIHLPRTRSRLTLTVTETKIERLQAISHDDAVAEGVGIFPISMSAQKTFSKLWQSLHGPQSWEANPEVVALTFTVHERNIDALSEAA